jgi:tetratricopeptide (TPR) repeat protein
MQKFVLSLMLFLSASVVASGQQAGSPRVTAPAQPAAGFITPGDVNVRIEPDVRTIVVMAALNAAGFDNGAAGHSLSPARAELRKDLATLDPQTREKLAAFYKAHRRPGVEEGADAARYAALSLLMTPPPAFSIYQSDDRPLPPDLKAILYEVSQKKDDVGERLKPTAFLSLLHEFYVKGGLRELIPKYAALGQAEAARYRRPVGETIYQVLDYFHTRPETVIRMRPLVVSSTSADKSKLEKQTVFDRNRTRQVFVIPDPLAAVGSSFVRGDILNQKEDILSRRIGDDYIVVVGPSRVANTEAVRSAIIRFVLDPMIERRLKNALEHKDAIVKLVAGAPAAAKEYSSSVYLVLRESLAQAAEVRMRRIQTPGTYSEDEAVFDLAQGYLRGAVLTFHFYQSLIGYEKVGINIEDAYDQMVATIKFDREAGRVAEFEPVVARVSAARASGSAKTETASASRTIAGKILASDDLIRERRFSDARAMLDEILAAEPNNARALYGMAQVLSQTPSPVELNPNGDENDKIQAQHDRLEQAIKHYRRAIQNALPETEIWLIQWSHVLLGRILDFQEFRQDAVVEYDAAIALGEVKNGAYKEALEGKQRPFGQKN